MGCYLMSTAPTIRAYLGGSFNPVHQGHIQMAMYVYNAIATIATTHQQPFSVSLLPNARSPFKEDTIAPAQRLAMLQLAIQGTPLGIDELELWQPPPVYTIDSVRTLRQRYPDDNLIFIMGMDSAHSLDQWKDGLALTDYVDLWIFNRSHDTDSSIKIEDNPHHSLSKQGIAQLITALPLSLQEQVTYAPTDLIAPLLSHSNTLKNGNQGRIYIDPRSVSAISSTQIREQLLISATASDTRTNPHAYANNPLNSLAKWLNPTVYQYIIAHQLYSAAQFR